MKWSQAICASILVDEFYTLSPHARSNLRSDLGVPAVPSEPMSRPRLFAADWGLPPKPVPTTSQRLTKLRMTMRGALCLNLSPHEPEV